MFDGMLESRRAGSRRRDPYAILASAAAHLGLLGLVLLGSLVIVEHVADPLNPDFVLSFLEPVQPEMPDLTPPPQRAETVQPPEPEPPVPEVEPEPERIEFRAQLPEPEIDIPKKLDERKRMQLAAGDLPDFRGSLDTPDVPDNAGSRTSARADVRVQAPEFSSGSYRDAAPVVVAGGARQRPNLPRPGTGLDVAGGGGGRAVAYGSSAPTLSDFVIPAGGTRGRKGGTGTAPAGMLGGVAGGTGPSGYGKPGGGVRYSYGGADEAVTAVGVAPGPRGGRPGSSAGARLDGVRSALASKYGLPLVAMNTLGQRSTEAQRWNLLLPEISELLRRSLRARNWRGASNQLIASIESDGSSVVVRYRDGIVHVIAATDDGLAALFLGRTAGSRAPTSRVQEAELARDALQTFLGTN